MANLDKKEINDLFFTNCIEGNLQEVKNMLNDPALNEKIIIKKENGSTLSFICWHGQLEVVKYLLTTPGIKEKSDINADGDNALMFACSKNHRNIVEYLLTSPELATHPKDINFALKCATSFGSLDVIDYLINDYKIEFTPELQKVLKKDTSKDIVSYKAIKEKFQMRDNVVNAKLKM